MITDGSLWTTPADASQPMKSSTMSPSLSDNFQVTKSLAQPSVNEYTGAPQPAVQIITELVDTMVPATGWIFLTENTANRYSNGIQVNIDSSIGDGNIFVSLSDTSAVMKDQAIINAGGTLTNAWAHWVAVPPIAAGGFSFFIDGQVRGIWVKAAAAGRITILSR